jgi:hypothetical protein
LLEVFEFLVLNPQVVMDRHPIISEMVYGPILRGKSIFENNYQKGEELLYLDTSSYYVRKLISNHPLIIYCRPPIEKILSFSDDHPQMDGIKDWARNLISRYDEVIARFEMSGANVYTYDFTKLCDLSDVDIAVNTYLKGAR